MGCYRPGPGALWGARWFPVRREMSRCVASSRPLNTKWHCQRIACVPNFWGISGCERASTALPHRTGVAAPAVLVALRVLRGRALLPRLEGGVPTSRSFPTCPHGPSTAELQLQGAVLSLLLRVLCMAVPLGGTVTFPMLPAPPATRCLRAPAGSASVP